jgi:hypothetical protein
MRYVILLSLFIATSSALSEWPLIPTEDGLGDGSPLNFPSPVQSVPIYPSIPGENDLEGSEKKPEKGAPGTGVVAAPVLPEKMEKIGKFMVWVASNFRQCDLGREFGREREKDIQFIEPLLYPPPTNGVTQDPANITRVCNYVINTVMKRESKCANCGHRSWMSLCAAFSMGYQTQICSRKPPRDHQFILVVDENGIIYFVDGYSDQVSGNVIPVKIDGSNIVRYDGEVVERDIQCLGNEGDGLFPAPSKDGPGFVMPNL